MSGNENGTTSADPPRSRPAPGTPVADADDARLPDPGQDDDWAASFGQERLWFLDRLSGGSDEYLLSNVWRVRGRLEQRAWQGALDDVTARHEVLRTALVEVDGRPVQRIASEVSVPVDWHDLSGMPAERRMAQARDAAGQLCAASFDLARAPLVRCGVWALDQDDFIVAVVFHHAVSDGWSTRILVEELTALYEARVTGVPALLPELRVQYADFAAWQRDVLTGPTLERQLGYWRTALDGVATLDLPTDRPRPAVRTGRGGAVEVTLPPSLVAELEALGRGSGATLFMGLLAVFQLVLARWSGQDDIAVGTPIAGRNNKDVEGLIGLFVNTLVIRGDLTGDAAFGDHLSRVRETVLEAFDHQDLPFERLVEELRPQRDLGHNPLFQAWFVLQNFAPAREYEGSVSLSSMSLDPGAVSSPFDISLLARPVESGMRLVFTYASDLFDEETVERLAGHLRHALERVVATPQTPVGAVELLSGREREVLAGFAGADEHVVDDGLVPDVFAAGVAGRADAVAVVCGERSLTFGELDARAEVLGGVLRALGVGPESRVGVCLGRGVSLVVALLGVWKAGGVFVPLDPGYPAARLAFMAADAGVVTVVTETAQLGLAAALAPAPVNLDTLSPADRPTAPARLAPDHLAYVIYTSGSTGEPKGVAVSHRSLARHVTAARRLFGVTARDRVLHFASFSFDASLDQLLPALTAGATVVIRPDEPWLPAHLPAMIRRHGITVINLPPAFWAEVVTHLPDPAAAPALAALRLLILGGETVPPEPLTTWRNAVPHVTVINAYGPTESTVTSTAHTVAGPIEHRIPIGRPLGGRRVYVLDSAGRLVPVGVPGELCIAGPELARGYLDRPALTAERFVPDPFGSPGGRMYRTGDRVRWLADGNLEFLGRLDHQVKLRGFRIELDEVSATLTRHPEITAAVATIHRNAHTQQLIAHIVTTSPLSNTTVRNWCARTLPDHMIPSTTITVPALPLLPSGKIDRDALPSPERNPVIPGTPYIAPRNPTEQAIADIWAEVLGVPRVGIDDGFFDLGGHSLLATMAISRIARKLSREVELRTLFEKPRIRDFAPEVTAAGGTGDGRVVPVARGGALAASFAQERLWFLDRLTSGGDEYAMGNVWRVRGDLDRRAWQGALDDVAARHEVLRTALVEADGRPVQRIASGVTVPVGWYDLTAVPAGQRIARARREAAELCTTSFDLARAPLVRSGVWSLGQGDFIAVVAFHHVVSDGWSAAIFVAELTAFYEARVTGVPAALPELRVQYADYAAWQRDLLTGPTLERQLAHWRTALDGVATLDLPTDRPRPAIRTGHGRVVEFPLPQQLLADLETLARESGATLFMVLLAAFQIVLARWSGQDDIAVGTPIAGRNRTEIEDLIGFFVNTLVIRADLSGDPTFAEHLTRVRANVLGAFDHQDLPFERIVEELRPERGLGHNPLFQVLFDVNNREPAHFTACGVEFTTFEIPWDTAKFDLSFAFTTVGDTFCIEIEYATDLFEADSMLRLAGHVENVLTAIRTSAEPTVRNLELLSGREREVLAGFAGPDGQVVDDGLLPDAFAARVARFPDAVAVVCGERSLTFGELDARAEVLGGALRALGVGPESRVGVCLGRGVDAVVALLGVWKAGGVFVPLDPGYPVARLAFMAADAGVVTVVTGTAHLGLAAALTPTPVNLDTLRPADRPTTPARLAPGHLAYVIYTSGSTGEPKGVAVSHRSLARHIASACQLFGLTRNDRVLQFASFSFDASLEQLLPALVTGATVVIRPDDIWTVDELCQRVRDEKITVMELVPAYWEEFAASLTEKSAESLGSLRLLITGGDVLPPGPTAAWFARLPEVQVVNTYGPTETAISATSFVVDSPTAHRIPIGRPLGGRRVYVLDSAGRLVPVGVPGELCIAGPELARGYLDRPALTAERFVPDPFGSPGGRMYRTGDRVRWLADGNLEFLGRLDDQVKLRGFRIELDEVSATLTRHPEITAAVATIHRNALIAHIVTTSPLSNTTVRNWCARTLPDHMIPSTTVTLPALPLLPSGKIDRAALPEPGGQEAAPETEFAAPETPTQDVVASVWAEVLGLDRVGVNHNFFALGGHSLRATMVASRLRLAFGCPVQVRDIFESPTVAALSLTVEQLLIDEIAAMSDDEIDLSLRRDF